MKAAVSFIALALVAAGCGGGVPPAPSPTSTPTGQSTSAASPEPVMSPKLTASPSAAASPEAGCPSVVTEQGYPPEPVPPPADVASLRVTGHVDLEQESMFVAADGDDVWATSPAGSLWRIDGATGKVALTVDLPDLGFARPLVASGSLWLAEMRSGRLLRLDPKDGSIVASVKLDPSDRPMALVMTDGRLLVANQTRNTLTFVDAESLEVGDRIDLSQGAPGAADRAPASIVVDGDIAWVVEHRADALARVNLEDGAATRTCLGDPSPGQIVDAAGTLWVSGTGGVVNTADRDSGEVTSRLFLPAVTAGELAVDGDTIWVGAGSHVVGIDAAAGAVSFAAPTGELSDKREFPGGVAIAVTSDSVWTTDPAGSGLLRFAKPAA